MRARELQAGIAAVWVVIVVLVTVILVVTACFLEIQFSDLVAQHKRMHREIEDINREITELQRVRAGLVEATGWEGVPLPTARVREWIQLHKFNADSEDARFYPVDIASPAAQQQPNFARDAEITTYLDNVEDIVHNAFLRAIHHRYLFRTHEEWKNVVVRHPEIVKKLAPGYSDRKPELKNRLLAEIGQVRQLMTQMTSSYQQRKAELEQQIDAIRREREENARNHSRFIEAQRKRIGEIRNIFEDLLRTKEPVFFHVTHTAVHGRLAEPDLNQKTAWIDIGSRHRVVPGLRFKVAQLGERHTFFFKGEVEVKRVFLTSAEVEIMRVYDTKRPLIHGDILVNPLFNRFRPLKIAFAGAEKPPRHRFTVSDAKRRLIEFNNIIQDKPDVHTDFLMWTDFKIEFGEDDDWGGEDSAKPGEYPPEYETAVLIGIPIATAKELYLFLGD